MDWAKSAGIRAISEWIGFGILLLAFNSLAAAQSDAPPPPPPPMIIGGAMLQGPGPEGPIIFHQEVAEGFEHKVVTGAPVSGDLIVTRDTTLADGNHIHNQSTTKIYRDADGRVRREVGFQVNTPATGAAKGNMVIITDPVAGKRYTLNPQNKTAHVMPLHPPKQGPPPEGGPGMWAKHDDSNVAREQLGSKTINGLQAEGTRVTRTIPAGQIGNDKVIQVVTERWYSGDLQIPLTTTHTDPMMGTVTTTLTNINRAAPDASLFQVPSDYTTETVKSGDMIYMQKMP